MIIDIHGHYTTAPQPLKDYRARQIEALKTPLADSFEEEIKISDDQIRESLEKSQLKTMRDRKVDMTIFSPIAGQMGHHIGNLITSQRWSVHCNNLIHRVTNLYPKNFIGVCQLPQSTGVSPKNSAAELERCVKELGFVGCNLNPDPSGGHWKDPPLIDKYWYPIYEKMVELDVPAMIHVSGSCNANFHPTGAHYINGDTTASARQAFALSTRPAISGSPHQITAPRSFLALMQTAALISPAPPAAPVHTRCDNRSCKARYTSTN